MTSRTEGEIIAPSAVILDACLEDFSVHLNALSLAWEKATRIFGSSLSVHAGRTGTASWFVSILLFCKVL